MKAKFSIPLALVTARKKEAIACAAAAALSLIGVATQAATVTLFDPSAVTGDTAAIATTAQADIGNGSWQAPPSKSSVYLTPAMLGLPVTTVGDLQSMSWNTYKTAADGANDWYLTIYTAPTGSGDAAGWYHNRITFEARYANSYSDPTDQWVTWSTDSGPNQVTFYDDTSHGQTNTGFYGGPTLSDLTSGAVNWGNYANSGSAQTVDYSGDTIEFLTLQTGSGWSPAYQGYLDNLSVTTTGGSAQVDFEAVPEPASIALLGLAAAGIGMLVTRRRR
ncbi:MAG TPA: PEP-CTERM sorting domain-containing protein [Lacipirellulaceae bacterium]|nr:PEP-CTERM sorting domain-containing protein [Lacipirellulaceae bacterium]